MTAAKQAAIKRFGGSNVLYGGAGNKILAAALGEVACSIQHRVGGPWDLCAPEAVLTGMGGRITDMFGEEIAMYGADAPPRSNERGYLATPSSSAIDHNALVAVVNADPIVQEYQKEVAPEVNE
jgi:3'(2'), 5'-bisphosphate nucleotidase